MFCENTCGILKVDMEMLKFIYKVIPYEARLIYYAFYKMRSSLDIEGLGEINVSIWQNIALGTLVSQNIVMQIFSGYENDMDLK